MTASASNRPLAAAIWMIAFGFCMAAVAALVRHITETLPVVEVTFFRGLGALPFLMPLFWRQGISLLKTDKPVLHILRAIMGALTMTAMFGAFSMVPLADATALTFLAPLFGSLLAVPLLGEIFGPRRAMSLLVAMIGAALILRPGFQTFETGHLLALCAAMGLACVSILLRKLGSSEPPERTVAYFTLFLIIGTMPMALVHWVTPDLESLILCLALGFAATAAQFCLTNAYRLAQAVQVMPWDFFRLILAALTGWILFGDAPGLHALVGGGLIVAAAVYTAWREMQLSQRVAIDTATGNSG